MEAVLLITVLVAVLGSHDRLLRVLRRWVRAERRAWSDWSRVSGAVAW